MKVVVPFPEPTSVAGAMTDEPEQADTKMSRARDSMELETMIQRRFYLKKVNDRGPRTSSARRCVMAPRRRGRIIQGNKPVVNSQPLMQRVGAVYIVHSPLPLCRNPTNRTDSTLSNESKLKLIEFLISKQPKLRNFYAVSGLLCTGLS
jgi:hypothetical protein